MLAIQVSNPGGVDALETVRLAWPEPAAGEVRVRALAIGVGKPDALIRQGIYKWMPALPAIPGNEMAGEIDAVGGEVAPDRIGERVLVSSRELASRGGCYAQAICIPATAAYSLPPGLDPVDAVSLPNYQLAAALLDVATGGWQPASVLVPGVAGGVGTALAQTARLRGIDVIGTVSSEAKREFAAAHGTPQLIRRDREDVAARVRELTGGRGVDIVYDHVGGRGLIAAFGMLAPLGMVVSYNALEGVPDRDVFGEMRQQLGRSLALRCFSIHTLDAMPTVRRAAMQSAIDKMAEGRLRAPAATVLPLADARRAHELLDRGETLGKLVLDPR
jgi:NADPH2:quinone reductase